MINKEISIKGYKECAAMRMKSYNDNKLFFNQRLDVKEAYFESVHRKNYYGEDLKEEFVKRLRILSQPSMFSGDGIDIDFQALENYKLKHICSRPQEFEQMIKDLLKFKK